MRRSGGCGGGKENSHFVVWTFLFHRRLPIIQEQRSLGDDLPWGSSSSLSRVLGKPLLFNAFAGEARAMVNDVDANRGPVLLSVSVTTTAFALLMCGVRFLVRHRLGSKLRWDDYSIVVSAVSRVVLILSGETFSLISSLILDAGHYWNRPHGGRGLVDKGPDSSRQVQLSFAAVATIQFHHGQDVDMHLPSSNCWSALRPLECVTGSAGFDHGCCKFHDDAGVGLAL